MGAVPPDWTGFQAYSPMPPPGYLASSPQPPPYMWGVQCFLQQSRRRKLEGALSGDLDNTPVIEQILKLAKAKLLGHNNYAELSMATKMATVDKAEELLEKLRSASCI
ncbi:putative oligopeptidase A [Helianthus annuus]|uniref:Oligopeptidase A n=1 Tax=Helianthus annuus TaxID=4232 RepID=A0A9K3JAF8_HELAN|nr:putative oligopeptidase A [Helianthus annuus]KAJ0581995.1 putative oligopeptidase A [Helianthus annuus]KAJ0597979.1 putative oligopeptidase A [Helianthus annuus]KAJ0758609.1 putative oligopeptidase A [Helianthus annuus]KAJ0762280.1 putative oligopeptidase A [Helianthus annuus]